MALDLLGYELTGALEAAAVLTIVALEAIVLYMAYTGYMRLFERFLGGSSKETDQP